MNRNQFCVRAGTFYPLADPCCFIDLDGPYDVFYTVHLKTKRKSFQKSELQQMESERQASSRRNNDIRRSYSFERLLVEHLADNDKSTSTCAIKSTETSEIEIEMKSETRSISTKSSGKESSKSKSKFEKKMKKIRKFRKHFLFLASSVWSLHLTSTSLPCSGNYKNRVR